MGLLNLIVAAPLFLMNKYTDSTKALIFIAILLSCCSLILLIVDTFIYQQYRFHINAMVIELFFAGGSEVISFPISMWLKIILTVMLIFLIQSVIATLLSKNTKKITFPPNGILWFIPLSFLIANVMHVWADGTYNKAVTVQSHYLPFASPLTAKKLMNKYGLLNVEAYKQQALLKEKKTSGDLIYPLAELKYEPITNKLSVVFIIIDSWRADMVSEEITPNISKFAQSSMQYNNHFSGSNNTRHGMFSLFYGLPGSYWDPFLQQQTSPILITKFIEQGYQAQIYASAKLTMPEFDETLFASINNLRTHSQGDTPWQRDINATQDFLANYSTSPSVDVLFLDAAHGFSIPNDFEKPFTPSLENINYLALNDKYEKAPFLNLYKNSLHFIDEQVGKVLSTIDKNLSNTIVIITGDHGEEFNDNNQGYWGHNSNFSEYQTHVPLIIYWPEKAPNVTTKLTSHVDLVPTIMEELFRVKNPATDYSSGQSLLGNSKRTSVLLGRNGYYAVKDENYIYELDRLGNFSIFNPLYENQTNAQLNMIEIRKAMDEMSRFYRNN